MTSSDQRGDATELNQELTQILVETGRRFGFDSVAEYQVKGGRLDVAWTWSPPEPMPGIEMAVPVVGFEIESSWRTRKHVKGDLLNLQDAGVALGVIVLAGVGQRIDSLRRFATSLVQRPGPRVVIWSHDEVLAIAGASTPRLTATAEAPSLKVTTRPAPNSRSAHSGKYVAIYHWLRSQPGSSMTVTFTELENVLGFPLPRSSRIHVQHWHSYEGSAVARAIRDAGWRASRVQIAEQTLTFVREC